MRGSEKPIPFEFLINGTFLRTTLDEYLVSHGISAESTIAIEYVKAKLPPLFVASFEHDDWVSSVDILSSSSLDSRGVRSSITPGQERIVSGGYDSFLRIWDTSSQVLATSPSRDNGGHATMIKAASFIDSSHIASSDMYGLIRVWKYAEDQTELTASLKPQIELRGHKGSVDSLSIHQSSNRILSGSADRTVGLWSTRKTDAPEAPPPPTPASNAKRRKTGPAVSTARRGPLALMESHKNIVTDATFAPSDHSVAYSVSWDNTLKTWDLTTSTCVDTRLTLHPLSCVAALPSLNLVATGSTARHIALIDPRASATTTSAMTLRGHKNNVVSLAADPESSYGLASGSHDGECRIWDVRSLKNDKDGRVGSSSYTIKREWRKDQPMAYAGQGVKVFQVRWDKDVGIVSASEDKTVQINQGQGIVARENIL